MLGSLHAPRQLPSAMTLWPVAGLSQEELVWLRSTSKWAPERPTLRRLRRGRKPYPGKHSRCSRRSSRRISGWTTRSSPEERSSKVRATMLAGDCAQRSVMQARPASPDGPRSLLPVRPRLDQHDTGGSALQQLVLACFAIPSGHTLFPRYSRSSLPVMDGAPLIRPAPSVSTRLEAYFTEWKWLRPLPFSLNQPGVCHSRCRGGSAIHPRSALISAASPCVGYLTSAAAVFGADVRLRPSSCTT